jgi:hypothetical protein
VGFLAPGFLLGALAVGLPLYLHWLRRQSSNPLPFSSIMLFERRQHGSARPRQLRYWLLLSARLAVLLLLAAAFAEPYVQRPPTAGATREKLLLVAIDDSFSMRAGTRMADAKRAALETLAARRSADRAQILVLDSQVSVLTQPIQDARALRAAVEGVHAGDARSSFGVLAAVVRAIARDERVPIELHLFSDLQKTSMPPSFTEMAMPANVRLTLHRVGQVPEPNWTVDSVAISGQVADLRNSRIQAVIAGNATPAATRLVSFLVNGKIIATQRVDVPASGRATAQIDLPQVPHGFNRCSVRIDAADALAADDEYWYVIARSDPQHGLFVHQSADTRSPLYFDTALSSASDPVAVLDKVTPEASANIDPSQYAFVVLSDVASLPDMFTSRLLQYARRGGSVMITLGAVAAQQPQIPLFGGAIAAAHNYSREAQRFTSVLETDRSYAAVGPVTDWEGVRFYYATSVDSSGARVVARLADQTPLLLEKPVGEGRVVLLTSGLDNLTNDLPLHPVFVAFAQRMVRYLTGSEAPRRALLVGDTIELRRARERAVGVELIDPLGERPLSLREATVAQSYQLTHAGFYELHLGNGRQDLVAANVDRRESDLAPIPEDTLALWRGGAEAPLPMPEPSASATSSATVRDLWWYAAVLLLAAVLLESLASSRYLGTLRDEP